MSHAIGDDRKLDARRVPRTRQPDERSRDEPVLEGLAGVRRRGPAASRHPRRVGALVHDGHRGHCDGPAAHDPRLLRLSEGAVRRRYPAPGDPAVAEEVADIAKPLVVGLDRDSWGLDHGTWSVLVHAFRKADVPVVQLSIDERKPFDYHLDLGARLQKLRERGILILGSGNVVHNLRAIDWARPDGAIDWARRFDDAAREMLGNRPADILRLREHPDFPRAVPTPDHFLPLVYIAGLAAAEGRTLRVLIDGYAYGSLSMAGYVLDAERPQGDGDTRPGARLPDPATIPPEETNT